MAHQVDFPRSAVEAFAREIEIPSRDEGLIRMTSLYGTQEYLFRELARGWEDGIRDFCCLKGGRQIGGTSAADVMALYWPQAHPGIQGMFVSDDDLNRNFRRDVHSQMLTSLPRGWRLPVGLDNAGTRRWANGSRLMYAAAGKREGSNLGRSRGLNFLVADEVGSWPEQKAVSALRASLSKHHALRLYLWISTARGFNVFAAMWKEAQRAVAQRAIFLAWWRHGGYTLVPGTPLWHRYATEEPRAEERQWIDEVERRYGVEITLGQVGWYRWQLAEEFFGDAALLAQEFGCLPEECFVSFGDHFIPPSVIQRLRIGLKDNPPPHAQRYTWGTLVEESSIESCDPHDEAAVVIWERPVPDGAYVVAAHPARSSSPGASLYVIQVYRAWPDHLVQVAEYSADSGAMYQFAWACVHLAGAYSTFVPAYFILELQMTGRSVLDTIQKMERFGHGRVRQRGAELEDLLGSIRHYIYFRVDSYTTSGLPQWQTQPSNRLMILHNLADEVQRGVVMIRSAATLDALAALRRGESGDADIVEGSGTTDESRAICAALAVEHWRSTAVVELADVIAPRERPAQAPEHVGAALVQGFLRERGIG